MNYTITLTNKELCAIGHLNFADDFELQIGKENSIILAANGIGKTSIYKHLKEFFKDDFSYIDYEESKDSLKKAKRQIVIGLDINVLEAKKQERDSLLKEYDTSKIIKDQLEISTKTAAIEISNELENKRNTINALRDFKINNYEKIQKIDFDVLKFIIKNFSLLNKLKKIEIEIRSIKDNFLSKAIENVEKYLEDGESKCPICDTEKSISIAGILENKKQVMSKMNDEFTKKIFDYFSKQNKTAEEIKELIPQIEEGMKVIVKHDLVNSGDAFNYIIVGGDDEVYEKFKNVSRKLDILSNDISKIEKEKEDFYKSLKNTSKEIRHKFLKNFKIESINFDEKDKNIVIDIPKGREVSSYSTGELNLMVFLVNIYAGVNGEKEVVVIDDPLSSYDIVNQYKIVYEIIKNTKHKKFFILTHNPDTLNIALSQHPSIFNFHYIEKQDGKLNIRVINIRRNIFNVEELLPEDPKDDSKKESYIRLLFNRDNKDKIFHYDESCVSDGYSNDFLVDIIDNFKSDSYFKDADFGKNCLNKTLLLTAVRVWVEKQFYLNHQEDIKLKKLNSIGEKIDYLFPKDKTPLWKGSVSVSREELMIRKVMLNQNSHPEGCRYPFHYALSLSIDDFVSEIEEIKKIFLEPDSEINSSKGETVTK